MIPRTHIDSRLVVFALTLLLSATSAAEDFVEIRGQTMGTTFSVKFPVSSPVDAEALQEKIRGRLLEINQHMSTYIEDSELSVFNRAEADVWTPVSADTAEVAALALQISKETHGAFDATVGPLVDLWGFGARRGAPEAFQPPDESQIADALAGVGYEKLHVRLDPPALKKDVARLRLDLSAIAKGYAVDELTKLTAEHGAVRAMVEIGGEVRVLGGRNESEPWRIGLESPVAEKRELAHVLPIRDVAVATSGDYRNYFEYDGARYSHTVDPRTGQSVRHSLASTTILAGSCARADALATAITVMGPERGLAWLNEKGVAGLLLVRTETGFEQLRSNAFSASESIAAQPIRTDAVTEKMASNRIAVFVLAGAVFGIALLGMAIGVLVSNRRLQGSCGGLANLRDEHGNVLCQACTKPSPECRGDQPQADTGPPSQADPMA